LKVASELQEEISMGRLFQIFGAAQLNERLAKSVDRLGRFMRLYQRIARYIVCSVCLDDRLTTEKEDYSR